jgi:hypothetical protein
MDDHIFGPPAPSRSTRPTSSVPWHKSEAKRLLERDLACGLIPVNGREMGTHAVYASRPEYAAFPVDVFTRRLASLRVIARGQNARRASDTAALTHDRQLRPQATHNTNGVPRWEGSDAELWLKEDITNGLHNEMAPQALYKTRVEYQVFTLDRFQGHIYQENKRRKFITSYYGR